jgi:hypothetical protein
MDARFVEGGARSPWNGRSMAHIESAIPSPSFLKFANPIVRFLLRSPLHFLVSGFMMLLEFKGRKTGKLICTPVSYHYLDGVPHVFTGAPWLRNLEGGASLDVIFKGQRRRARAEVVSDDEVTAASLHRVFSEIGPGKGANFAFKISGGMPSVAQFKAALAGRRTLRVHFDA